MDSLRLQIPTHAETWGLLLTKYAGNGGFSVVSGFGLGFLTLSWSARLQKHYDFICLYDCKLDTNLNHISKNVITEWKPHEHVHVILRGVADVIAHEVIQVIAVCHHLGTVFRQGPETSPAAWNITSQDYDRSDNPVNFFNSYESKS